MLLLTGAWTLGLFAQRSDHPGNRLRESQPSSGPVNGMLKISSEKLEAEMSELCDLIEDPMDDSRFDVLRFMHLHATY